MITVGIRGDGDVAMGKGNDEENMQLLRKVVADQREIIKKVYGKDAAEVPDDVTLLFFDNNWGLHSSHRPGK